MSEEQHRELLDMVRGCKGRVMLSGYHSALYADQLRDWTRHEFALPNQAAGGKQKRRMTEVVWCNFSRPPRVPQAAKDQWCGKQG